MATNYRRLRELEQLEWEGIRLTAEEAAELQALLNAENQDFVSAHEYDLDLTECDALTERSLETGRY